MNLRLGLSGFYYQQVTDDDYDIDATLPPPVQDLLQKRGLTPDVGVNPLFFAYRKLNLFVNASAKSNVLSRNFIYI